MFQMSLIAAVHWTVFLCKYIHEQNNVFVVYSCFTTIKLHEVLNLDHLMVL